MNHKGVRTHWQNIQTSKTTNGQLPYTCNSFHLLTFLRLLFAVYVRILNIGASSILVPMNGFQQRYWHTISILPHLGDLEGCTAICDSISCRLSKMLMNILRCCESTATLFRI